MSDVERPSQSIIWATRGRSWGFRFMLRGGLSDPLLEYERIFGQINEEPEAWGSVSAKVAVRLRDPEGRKDASGRVIPHQFVVSGDLASSIGSLEHARSRLWPLVADIYAEVWQSEEPPASDDIAARLDEGQAG